MGKLAVKVALLALVAAPLVAAITYPSLRWLFWVPVVGIVLFVVLTLINIRFGKDPDPIKLAQTMERILTATDETWDVDDFESRTIRNPLLAELRERALNIGLPETWASKSEQEKAVLRGVIDDVRNFGQRKTDSSLRSE